MSPIHTVILHLNSFSMDLGRDTYDIILTYNIYFMIIVLIIRLRQLIFCSGIRDFINQYILIHSCQTFFIFTQCL